MTNGKQQTRFLADLSCAFGPTPDAPRSGTITSIGPKECFVKTKATVMEGQMLHVRVWMSDRRWLRLSGKVKYHMDRVGFGVIFHDLTDEQTADLARLVEELRRQHEEQDADYDPADFTLTGRD
ncbi:MAG TPA: hypothetical protein VJ866_06600 [Pyrinomonadaceae bacterium]|nr:hypothetical protein [Pyrinomonadaceae bacterium]